MLYRNDAKGGNWLALLARSISLLAVLCSLVLVGCGGGGESAPLTPPNGTFRMLRVGDTWTYDVSGTFTNLETGEKVSAVGTERIDIEPSDVEGTLAMKVTLNLTAGGRPIVMVEHFLIGQDTDGTIYNLAKVTPNGIDMLQSPIVIWRSPMSVGQVVDWTGQYVISGSITSGSYRVDSVERVSTPAGQFVAFKVTESEQELNSLGQQISSSKITYWVVPQLGQVMFKETTTDYADKISWSFTVSLKAYQLSP